jgi:hypothetical protein
MQGNAEGSTVAAVAGILATQLGISEFPAMLDFFHTLEL